MALGTLGADLVADHPEFAEWLEGEGNDTLSCFHFLSESQRRVRKTNGCGLVNQELKRRARVVRLPEPGELPPPRHGPTEGIS